MHSKRNDARPTSCDEPQPTVIELEREIITWDDVKDILGNTLSSLKEEGTMLSVIYLRAVVVMTADIIEMG